MGNLRRYLGFALAGALVGAVNLSLNRPLAPCGLFGVFGKGLQSARSGHGANLCSAAGGGVRRWLCVTTMRCRSRASGFPPATTAAPVPRTPPPIAHARAHWHE